MDRDILAIADQDTAYMEKFANYIQERYEGLFECHLFSGMESLMEYGLENPISVLLIDPSIYDPGIKRLKAEKIFLLDEEDKYPEGDEIRKIDRFKSADSIIKEILKECSSLEGKKGVLSGTGNTCLYTVFSPVTKCLKTTLAVCLSQLLSDRGRTLYINTEFFSGFNQIFMKKYETDLSDLLLYMKGKGPNFRYRLQSAVDSSQGFDYIPPGMMPDDIFCVEKEIWLDLIEESGKCGYEYLVLDCGGYINGLLDILKKSERILMPVRQDGISRARLNQFEALLHISGYEELIPMIEKLQLPYFEKLPSIAGDLRYTGLGEYAGRILS